MTAPQAISPPEGGRVHTFPVKVLPADWRTCFTRSKLALSPPMKGHVFQGLGRCIDSEPTTPMISDIVLVNFGDRYPCMSDILVWGGSYNLLPCKLRRLLACMEDPAAANRSD